MTSRLRYWLGAAALAVGIAIGAQLVRPLPPILEDGFTEFAWVDAGALAVPGFGDVSFRARDGNVLTAHVYRATGHAPSTGPVWFVMHGAGRTAERYLETAAAAAERHAALAVAIEFPRSLYPNHSSYTLGVTTSGSADADALREGRWRAPEDTVYGVVEDLFDGIRARTGGTQEGYYLFGHSAGAQFTHRLLTFLPAPRVLRAVAANAGWYTLPESSAAPEHTMPYGLNATPVTAEGRRALLAAPLTLLLGERDTAGPDAAEALRDTAEAMAQGENRFERGQYYHATGREVAGRLGTTFAWRLETAARAGHAVDHVVDSAAYLLFHPDPAPCEPTPAALADVTIVEVLADPPDGLAGDLNRDGQRDPQDDEYVVLQNTGDGAVCLAGWALGDAENGERHVFPFGSELAAGGRLRVFGGGVPVGDFDAALVQRATFDGQLGLSNAGDVLTLRDANDVTVAELSWGDCDGSPCAGAHWPDDLATARALVLADGAYRERRR